MTNAGWAIRQYVPFDEPGESISMIGSFPSIGSRYLDKIKVFQGMFGLPSYLIWYVHKDLESYNFDRYSLDLKLYIAGDTKSAYYREQFRVLHVDTDFSEDKVKVFAVSEDWATLQTRLIDYDVGTLPYDEKRTVEGLLREVIEKKGIFGLKFEEHDDKDKKSIQFEYPTFTCEPTWTVYDFIDYIAKEQGFEWAIHHGILFIGPELHAYKELVANDPFKKKTVNTITKSLFFTKVAFEATSMGISYNYDLLQGEELIPLRCIWFVHWAGADGDTTKACFIERGESINHDLYHRSLENAEEREEALMLFSKTTLFNQIRVGRILDDTGTHPYVDVVSIQKDLEQWEKKVPRNVVIETDEAYYELLRVGRTSQYVDNNAGLFFPSISDPKNAPNSIIFYVHDRVEEAVMGPFVYGNGDPNFGIPYKEKEDFRFTMPEFLGDSGPTLYITQLGDFTYQPLKFPIDDSIPDFNEPYLRFETSGHFIISKNGNNYFEMTGDSNSEFKINVQGKVIIISGNEITIENGTSGGTITVNTTGVVNIGADASAVNLAGGAKALAHANHDHVFSHTHSGVMPGPSVTGPATPSNTNPCTDNTTKTKAD